MTSGIAALKPDHVAALETLFGAGPGHPRYREAVRQAMVIGMIRRAESGGMWGKSEKLQDIRWGDADEEIRRLKGMIVTDLEGCTVEVRDPVINRHMASDRVAIDIAQGKATIKLEWWRVRELTMLGAVLGNVPGWYTFDILDAEVFLLDGTRHRVGVVDGHLAGKVPLGEYRIQLAKLRKIVPITALHHPIS